MWWGGGVGGGGRWGGGRWGGVGWGWECRSYQVHLLPIWAKVSGFDVKFF